MTVPDYENLNPSERWMVIKNVEYAVTEGVDVVAARLNANGYHRVADTVERVVAAAKAQAPSRSQTCVVVVRHDPEGSIADDTDLIRCGNPVEREHGGWPMCAYHISIFQPAAENIPHLRIEGEDDEPIDVNQVVGRLLYPNGVCPACGNGLDDEHRCQDRTCDRYEHS